MKLYFKHLGNEESQRFNIANMTKADILNNFEEVSPKKIERITEMADSLASFNGYYALCIGNPINEGCWECYKVVAYYRLKNS